jgi:hypothetical protein
VAGKPDPKTPLRYYINTQRLTDAELKRLMREAAAASRRIVSAMPQDAFSTAVRKAQLDLSNSILRTWTKVQLNVETGIGRSVLASARALAELQRLLVDSVGISPGAFAESLQEQARKGIDAIIARQENGISLSERVYKDAAWFNC